MIPYLLVKPPSGEEFCLPLTRSQYTIGRFPDNDIFIPDTLVSRQHCKLEKIRRRWHITDLHSRNGTFLKRSLGKIIKVEPKAEDDPDKVCLNRFDVICISDWELKFHDQSLTDPPEIPPEPVGESSSQTPKPEDMDCPFVYNIARHTLYYQQGDRQVELEPQPRPQLNLMLDYMIKRNLEKGQGQAICCTFEELRIAIWGVEDAHFRPNTDIHGLARELRRLFIRYVSKERADALMQTRPRRGYILNIKCQ